jgi:acyl carrier protein
MDILSEVSRIVAAHMDPQPQAVGLPVPGQMGIDSLSFVEVIMELEETFAIQIPDEAVHGVETPEQLAAVVERLRHNHPRAA